MEILSLILFYFVVGLVLKTLYECMFQTPKVQELVPKIEETSPKVEERVPEPHIDYSDFFWDIQCEDMRKGCVIRKTRK